jgi:L-ribulose-5-phosphate 4-epimerase
MHFACCAIPERWRSTARSKPSNAFRTKTCSSASFSRDRLPPINRSRPVVLTFDGTVVAGPKIIGDPHGFAALLARRPDITTAVHIHSTYLGAWSQTHRPLPINYVPVQRWTLASEIPVYIDRRQPQVDFILERLAENPSTPAILEANGGATVWGTRGFVKTIEYAQLIEEGAQFQLLAEAIGGSKPFGPGVLEQQFALSGLTEQARAAGRLR